MCADVFICTPMHYAFMPILGLGSSDCRAYRFLCWVHRPTDCCIHIIVIFTNLKEDKYVTTITLNLIYIMLHFNKNLGFRSDRRVRVSNYPILTEHTLLGMFFVWLERLPRSWKQLLWQLCSLQKLNRVFVGFVLLTCSQGCWLQSFALWLHSPFMTNCFLNSRGDTKVALSPPILRRAYVCIYFIINI